MEPPPPPLSPLPSGQEAPPRGPEPEPAEAGGGGASSSSGRLLLLATFQYLHVHLAGGAPWGFTLKGGLEHGEPLIVSKVEDGGKAALSQKMRSGDELVNINGTPLYGSRQEALILIKGSYRTLKMIIRRRSVPVIRPHSWHLAKLSEVRTEAATMPCPANAFSLSWHSGCDTSDLSLPWTSSLSRHCSTDQSSSLGSMESLDPPGQSSYYEGSLSPVDQAMDQNKRDSAYSSFSASSTTSDSALRPEETSTTEGHPPGPLPDQRYLQTGSESGEPPDQCSLGSPPATSPRPATCAPTRTLPGVAKVAVPPPQPPVRQDSLRACHPPPEATRADPLRPHVPWASDTALSTHTKDAPLATDSLPTDQYYLLSSHTEPPPPAMEKGNSSTESLVSKEQGGGRTLEGPQLCVERDRQGGEAGGHDLRPSGWKANWTGPLGHRHSTPEHLLSAQLQAMDMAPIQEKTHWTVSPLHPEPARLKASDTWQDREPDHATPDPTEGPEPHPAWEGGSCSPLGHEKRPRSASAEPASSLPPEDATDTGFQRGSSREGLQETEGGPPPVPRKGGLAPHRSAQMRRRSDRFATNLRHEIQWRKAQLQKAKGSIPLLPCGEERLQEREEAPGGESGPDPPTQPSPAPSPPPPVETRLPSFGPQVRRWGSELSIFVGDQSPLRSPGRTPFAAEPRWGPREPEHPPKPLPATPRRGGRWRWSPEHKLQPHNEGSPAARPETQPPSVEDSGLLLPFADRRKFFEETSRPLSMGYSSLGHSQLGGWPPTKVEDQSPFQPSMSPEPQALQGRIMDPPSYSTPPSPIYADFCREAPGFYPPLARHRGDCDCWQPPPCARAPREAYAYYCGERCPSLHQRNLPVPAGCCTHHCHPHPAWSGRCTECRFLAPHRRLEEARPWQARKEFPPEEWEPPTINRKNSQSMSELPLYKADFARGATPFWTHFENHQLERAPFCRFPSNQNLFWDCERPGPTTESPAYEEPRMPPLRERAYSESHLCMEPARARPGLEAAPRGPGTDRAQEGPPQARLEDCRRESPGRVKKKGPPPPRPPPPKWENYRPRRASHHPLLPSKAPPEDPRGPGQNSLEMARQRSQSLPLGHLWKEEEEEEAHLPCPGPREAPSSGGPGSLHYYHYGSRGQTPDWPPAPTATSDQSGSPRPVSSSEEEEEEEEEEAAAPEPPRWEKDDQSQTKGGQQPAGHQRSPHSPELELASQGAGKESVPPATGGPPPPPFRLNSEELMRDVVGRDRSLAGVLSPALGRMTATEVMGDLFSPSDSPTWKEWGQVAQAPGAGLAKRPLPQPLSLPGGGSTGSPTPGTAGYNSSLSQAEQEKKAKKEARELARASSEEEEELDHDLARKKVQLIESISRKLAVLQEAQQGLQEDLNANASLGREVEGHIKGACKSQEYEKFRLFIGDLDKVVNLLLSLSGRLARVENALESLDPEAPEEEKLALREKKRQLTAQLEDAKELREHVARRERLVLASVSCCLPSEQLQDYQHFVRMKSALAIQQRQLDDKIKLGQEQLRCLRDSLRQETREY